MEKKFTVVLFLCFSILSFAQAPAYYDAIQAFKNQDSIQMPEANSILFIGSSSFTKWTDIQNYFPSYPIINRGFGGSTLSDVIRYEDDIIIPYHPKQIVIYCGENDLVYDSTVTGKTVFTRFKKLYTDIRTKLGNLPLIYISMKPSPARWYLKEKELDGNNRIKKFLLKKNSNAKFIDVWPAMLGADGKPLPDIFIEDNLHMNAKGYHIWQQLIEPHLLK